MSKRNRARVAAGDHVLKTVTVLGVKVAVKRRRGTPNLQLEANLEKDGQQERMRVSAKTADLEEAIVAAKAYAAELAKELGMTMTSAAEWLIARGVELTIGEVFDVYRELRFPSLAYDTKLHMGGAMKHFTFVWGRDLRVADINQPLVDQFIAARVSGIEGPGLSEKSARGVCLGSARGEIVRLGTIFNFVGALKHEGKAVFPSSPLTGVRLPPDDPNVRRPVASARRYRLLLQYEPKLLAHLQRHYPYKSNPHIRDLYRMILVIARETGRRIGAIRRLRMKHLLRTEEQVRTALATAGGFHDEEWADSWPAGAIHWARETDKKRFARVTPLSRRVRRQLESYLAEHPDAGNPEAYVFPHPSVPGRCIDNEMLWRWMNTLEEIVRENGHVLPKLAMGQYHPFRRMWRSERSGAFDARLISMVGGWSVKTGVAMDDSYQWFSPTAAYLCVEFDPAVHRTAANPVPGVSVPGLAEQVLSPEHLKRELSALRGELEGEDDGNS
jgi:integrase/ribosomal protein L28